MSEVFDQLITTFESGDACNHDAWDGGCDDLCHDDRFVDKAVLCNFMREIKEEFMRLNNRISELEEHI